MFRKILHRPIFSVVISLVIVFMGGLAITQLPISQFPEIAPTTVNIFIAYPAPMPMCWLSPPLFRWKQLSTVFRA